MVVSSCFYMMMRRTPIGVLTAVCESPWARGI